ncbi:Uncharacterised protein [Mycobacteroides abscessus subsp. abscessus]|nr:Uncharacterised protein [Mycobacteroides abscessus subsp. abscessus]
MHLRANLKKGGACSRFGRAAFQCQHQAQSDEVRRIQQRLGYLRRGTSQPILSRTIGR